MLGYESENLDYFFALFFLRLNINFKKNIEPGCVHDLEYKFDELSHNIGYFISNIDFLN